VALLSTLTKPSGVSPLTGAGTHCRHASLSDWHWPQYYVYG